MRNSLYIIGLSFALVSCGSQQPATKVTVAPKKPVPAATPAAPKAVSQTSEKPQLLHEGQHDFYRINIADASKNDNTVSYGSIVSAKPQGFKIVKTFFPSLGQNFRQRHIILHYTALDDDKSVSVLTQQAVSSHYLVNSTGDNEIYQLVDENKRAYHAGISSWRKDSQLNDTSIGIEIVNAGYTTDATGFKTFPEYPEKQFRKVAALVKDIADRYMIPPTNILAHSDIAPTRKQDPGPKFPWKRLYDEYQIGMWYDEATKQSFYNMALAQDFPSKMLDASFIYQVQQALKAFGYGIEPSGIMDDGTKKTIEAFQYRFRPENYSGVMDAETWAILQALNQKYPSK